MAQTRSQRIAQQKERIRNETLQMLLNEKSPFEQRIVDAICAHELPEYDWITSQEKYVEANDKRLALMKKIASSDIAAFHISAKATRFNDYGAIGRGVLVCRLDTERPWSIAKIEKDEGSRDRVITAEDVVLRAHPIPETATAFYHTHASSHDYVAGTDVYETPGVLKFSEPFFEVKLPKTPTGVEYFTSRLHHLGAVASYGVKGIVELAKKVALDDREASAQVTLLHAALRYYSGDESWKFA